MAEVAFLCDPRFVEHRTGAAHPERPDRIRAIARAARAAGLIVSPDPFPEFDLDLGLTAGQTQLVELPPAEPADLNWLRTIHDDAYIDRVRQLSRVGGMLDADTVVGIGSYEIALLAVGGVLACCDFVAAGRKRRAFAAIRPPGHHAEPDKPMGFCLFANVAIACRYLQRRHGLARLAVVDFDVHHGNGTQAYFYDDPDVLFISLHQDPRTCYPGTGYASETGSGAGTGATVNLPFAAGATDGDYLRAFEDSVLPALTAFRPNALLISAGFDAHRDDPLASVDLSDQAFFDMTRQLADVADTLCDGRIVSVLEGGYNLRALGRSVVQHLQALA